MRSMRADLQRWEPRQVLSYMPLRPSGGSWDGDRAVGFARPRRGGGAAHRGVRAVLRRDLVVRHGYPFVTRKARAIRVTVVTESTLKPSTSPCSSPVVHVLSVRSWFF